MKNDAICANCGTLKVEIVSSGYEPVDGKWLPKQRPFRFIDESIWWVCDKCWFELHEGHCPVPFFDLHSKHIEKYPHKFKELFEERRERFHKFHGNADSFVSLKAYIKALNKFVYPFHHKDKEWLKENALGV